MVSCPTRSWPGIGGLGRRRSAPGSTPTYVDPPPDHHHVYPATPSYGYRPVQGGDDHPSIGGNVGTNGDIASLFLVAPPSAQPLPVAEPRSLDKTRRRNTVGPHATPATSMHTTRLPAMHRRRPNCSAVIGRSQLVARPSLQPAVTPRCGAASPFDLDQPDSDHGEALRGCMSPAWARLPASRSRRTPTQPGAAERRPAPRPGTTVPKYPHQTHDLPRNATVSNH